MFFFSISNYGCEFQGSVQPSPTLRSANDVYFNILEEVLFLDILAMILCLLSSDSDGEEGI